MYTDLVQRLTTAGDDIDDLDRSIIICSTHAVYCHHPGDRTTHTLGQISRLVFSIMGEGVTAAQCFLFLNIYSLLLLRGHYKYSTDGIKLPRLPQFWLCPLPPLWALKNAAGKVGLWQRWVFIQWVFIIFFNHIGWNVMGPLGASSSKINQGRQERVGHRHHCLHLLQRFRVFWPEVVIRDAILRPPSPSNAKRSLPRV